MEGCIWFLKLLESVQKLISSKVFENWFRWFFSLLVLLAAWYSCTHSIYSGCYAKLHLLQRHWQMININVQANWSFFSRLVLIQKMPSNGMEVGIFQWDLQIRGL